MSEIWDIAPLPCVCCWGNRSADGMGETPPGAVPQVVGYCPNNPPAEEMESFQNSLQSIILFWPGWWAEGEPDWSLWSVTIVLTLRGRTVPQQEFYGASFSQNVCCRSRLVWWHKTTSVYKFLCDCSIIARTEGDFGPSQVILDYTNTALFLGSVVYLFFLWLGTCVLLFLCLVQSWN